MPRFAYHAQQVILPLFAAVFVQGAGMAYGALAPETMQRSAPALFPLLEESGDAGVQPLISAEELHKTSYLTEPLTKGLWSTACARATNILANQQPVVDALGIFAMCAAIHNDKDTVNATLKRLKEAEPTPHYYEQLTQGILQLRNKSPDKAGDIFKNVLQQRSGDPLALYFVGEALHAQGKDAEAISSFKSSLDAWPDHAPALFALARLTASGTASKSALQSAIATTERAAKIDPAKRAYWQQLADLCDRAGEHGRANAIRLQWLTPRNPK